MDGPIWDATVLSKNRDRLLAGDVARAVLREVMEEGKRKGLLSEENFTVDGTLTEANASMKSFRKKEDDPPEGECGGRNVESDFRGSLRSAQLTCHESAPKPTRKGNAM